MSIQPPKITHDPIYDRFFHRDGVCNENWNEFCRYDAFTDAPLAPDYSNNRFVSWKETATKIIVIILKIILFPWGIYDGLKHLSRILGMRKIYPAHAFGKYHVHNQRFIMEQNFANQNALVYRDLVLEKDGVSYSGLLLGKPETLSNRKWAIFAVGNYGTIEDAFLMNSHLSCLNAGYNLLMVNGPSVGLSDGSAVPEEIGNVQKLGIDFLVDIIGANKLVLAGHSLGGGAMGGAINKLEFHTDTIQYLVIRMMTFDKLSRIVKKLGGVFADGVRWWLDYEINSVTASQKLAKLDIHEVIFTAEDDELMSRVHLGKAVEDVSSHKKTLVTVRGAKYPHLGIPRELVERAILNWDKNPNVDNLLPDIHGVVQLTKQATVAEVLLNQEEAV